MARSESGRGSILVDAGPLVAILGHDESGHAVCTEAMDSAPGRLLTCWPVVAEAAWLLRRHKRAHDGLLLWIESGVVELADLTPSDMPAVRAILDRFDSLNPQFADACLVHLAEREGIDTIFTLDRRDFSVYRTSRGKAFRLLPEGA